jgi:predicted phosphodiesterase
MYQYRQDRERLIERVIELQAQGEIWENIILLLNYEYDEEIGADAWRKRFERAKTQYIKKPKANEVDISKIKEYIIKALTYGCAYDKLPSKFGINKYELDGILKEIEEDGIYGVRREFLNGSVVLYLDRAIKPTRAVYTHSVGKERTLKVMVLSDTHLGSKNEQLSFVNWLYDEAERRGVRVVYHCGDISEGIKRSRPEHIYSLHAISFDEQAEHIVKNYPYKESITTYFITGNHDHWHIQNGGANIGKAISLSRKDMVYLGMNNAVIEFGNCKINLFHAGDGSSYATSYAGQKYLDSLSGGDKPNILLAGHHHKSLYFVYRNVHYFEVPSCCLQSDWEKGKRIQNTSGAWFLDITIDDEGSVIGLKAESIIQYKKTLDDWKGYK